MYCFGMSEINTENIITFLQQLMLWTKMCKSELATVKYDSGGFDLIFIYEHARAIIPTEGVGYQTAVVAIMKNID